MCQLGDRPFPVFQASVPLGGGFWGGRQKESAGVQVSVLHRRGDKLQSPSCPTIRDLLGEGPSVPT